MHDVGEIYRAGPEPEFSTIMIGDSATLGGHPFYAALIEYFQEAGAYHTVWEEPL